MSLYAICELCGRRTRPHKMSTHVMLDGTEKYICNHCKEDIEEFGRSIAKSVSDEFEKTR